MIAEADENGSFVKYGMRWSARWQPLDVELWCYKHDKRPEGTGGRLTRFEHFYNIVEMTINREDSTRRFIWNRWAIRMIKGMIYNKFVGIVGCGSSGKSDSAALYALVEYMAAPTATQILITSTNIRDAKKRVWKSIVEYWGALEPLGIPGKLVDSKNAIVGLGANGKFNDAYGITLIPAGGENEKQAARKIVGQKAYYMRFIADELNELGDAILNCRANLDTNPDFQLIAMGNPAMMTDPLGRFCEPLKGWDSVSEEDFEWKTKEGMVLRFDATMSPRFDDVESYEKFHWMPSQDAIDLAAERFGRESRQFYQMYRGMWLKGQEAGTVFSEFEFIKAMNLEEPKWDGDTVTIMALDASFTQDGDRSPLVTAMAGYVGGKRHIHITTTEIISEDAGTNVSHTILTRFKTAAEEDGVSPRHCGYDATGAGVTFGQWIDYEWSPDVRKINFGGAPLERTHTIGDSGDNFANRVAQLWVQCKQLLRQECITGVSREMVKELVLRRYDERKIGHRKVHIESKRVMKARTGYSPDLADAFVILIEVAIMNGLLVFEETRKTHQKANQNFRQMSRFIKRPKMKRMSYNRRA